MSVLNVFLAGTRNAKAASLGAFACHERLSFHLLVASGTLLGQREEGEPEKADPSGARRARRRPMGQRGPGGLLAARSAQQGSV